MIDDLELEVPHAEAIIQKAIEFEVYSDEMPDTKKDKMEAAHEIVAFAIDSWVNDGMRPDAKDDDEAAAGKMIEEIFEIAGVEIDDDNDVTYNEPPELDGSDDGDDDGDDEAPFDIEDVIEGYEELTAATRVKKVKALELDPAEDDDYNTLVGIAEWEESQDKPASRVLDYINDLIPPEGDDDGGDDQSADDAGDDDNDGDDDGPWTEEDLLGLDKDELAEVAGEFDVEMPKRLTDTGKKRTVAAILEAQDAGDDDGDGDADVEGDADEEPWEGYDESSVADIIEVVEDDERTVEELEYVLSYEEGADKPRTKIVKAIKAAIEALNEGDDDNGDDEPEPEPEEKPARGRRGRAAAKKDTADPDDDDGADEAKARDDRKDARKGKGGKLIITRDQILAALSDGEVTIDIG